MSTDASINLQCQCSPRFRDYFKLTPSLFFCCLTGIPKELGKCGALTELFLQENKDLEQDVPQEVETLSHLCKIHLNKGLEIKGQLGEDGKAAMEIWEAMGKEPEELKGEAGGDIFEWKSVKVEDCGSIKRITELSE